MNTMRVNGVEIKPTSIVVNTGEDKIALMLGRALVRAEMLQARVEALEAELAAATAPEPAKAKPARQRQQPKGG